MSPYGYHPLTGRAQLPQFLVQYNRRFCVLANVFNKAFSCNASEVPGIGASAAEFAIAFVRPVKEHRGQPEQKTHGTINQEQLDE